VPGNIQRDDAIQMAFLMLVAGNATMVNMINLVGRPAEDPEN
jgi:nitric oxide reductase